MAVFRVGVFILLLAYFVTVGFGADSLILDQWSNEALENSISREEATCRYKLYQMETWQFYVIAAGICTLSFIFLLASIGVFIYVQRYVMKEMDEAVYKGSDVMDAVMTALIPNSLLEEIGEKEKKHK